MQWLVGVDIMRCRVSLHVPRALHLSLAPHPTIWSKDFRAVTEDGQGRQALLPLNRNHFYSGTVLGRPTHLAHTTPS